MSSISIFLTDNATSYLPGEQVGGVVAWNLGAASPIEVRLFWHTRGKGTQDVSIVQTVRIGNATAQGEHDFSFTLPESPYSFSGKLISLIWGIEAVATGSSDVARIEIIVSPTGSEVLLGTAESA